eukprot:1153419-Pelagomonas_calceolata.AAC.3
MLLTTKFQSRVLLVALQIPISNFPSQLCDSASKAGTLASWLETLWLKSPCLLYICIRIDQSASASAHANFLHLSRGTPIQQRRRRARASRSMADNPPNPH